MSLASRDLLPPGPWSLLPSATEHVLCQLLDKLANKHWLPHFHCFLIDYISLNGGQMLHMEVQFLIVLQGSPGVGVVLNKLIAQINTSHMLVVIDDYFWLSHWLLGNSAHLSIILDCTVSCRYDQNIPFLHPFETWLQPPLPSSVSSW